MEFPFVLNFPKPRIIVWPSKISDSCMIPCSSCVLKNICHGQGEEWNDSTTPFPLWREYEYLWGPHFPLFIPGLTLVSDLHLQPVGMRGRNHNHSSVIGHVALKTVKRSIKMMWSCLQIPLKKIFIFVMHQLFFLLPHPQNQEMGIRNIISHGGKNTSWKYTSCFLFVSFNYYFPRQNKFCSLCVNTKMRPPIGPRRGICTLFNPEVVNLAYIFLRQPIHHLKLYANFFVCGFLFSSFLWSPYILWDSIRIRT